MPRSATEIDRLIEQGLTLYGEGDLDAALLLWERVLAIDPANPQANSYVEYVRLNYELLTAEANQESSEPYGVGDEDYQIEILPGEVIEPSGLIHAVAAREEGWGIGDEHGGADDGVGDAMELEADEPPQTFDSAQPGEEINFEDATREYPGGAGRPNRSVVDGRGSAAEWQRGVVDVRQPAPLAQGEFAAEVTPAFGTAGDSQTPVGFGAQTTDIKRRDFGFVQPAEPEPPPSRQSRNPHELKVTLRTPPNLTAPPRGDGLSGELARGTGDPLAAPSDHQLAAELARTEQHDAHELDADSDDKTDLIASLPFPRAPLSPTKPLPGPSRPPASLETPTLDGAPAIEDLGRPPAEPVKHDPFVRFGPPIDPNAAPPAVGDLLHPATPTRDLADSPTPGASADAAPAPSALVSDAMISAPTRDLGLRADAQPEPPTDPRIDPRTMARPEAARPDAPAPVEPPAEPRPRALFDPRTLRALSDDETTAEVDLQRLRAARNAAGKPDLLGMDSIDARGAEILERIDRNAPAGENREDRTRRRITALLEHASEWIRGSDFERAAIAVDLALSEDPNSALAQKLIHRNREHIMNAFQSYLGDLQRTPSLARPLHELGSAPISPRAAFLLSRVDGQLSLDEILDVSGMPRIEAYRYLCQLLLRQILR